LINQQIKNFFILHIKNIATSIIDDKILKNYKGFKICLKKDFPAAPYVKAEIYHLNTKFYLIQINLPLIYAKVVALYL
jgi:hypothetical protein